MRPLPCLAALCLLACSRPPTSSGDDPPLSAPDLLPWGARLRGKVWGPGHRFPVSGAVVAALKDRPPDLPEGTYCQRCLALPAAPYAVSGPDGTFTLELPPGGAYHLVVQKGEFRRVRPYTAPGTIGDHSLDEALTTLPSRRDPAVGDRIPSIALVFGDYDHLGDVLAKAGLGDEDAAHGLRWGSEVGVFDVYDNSGPTEKEHHGAPLKDLLYDPARLARYHVLFFACSYNANFKFMAEARVQENLREYVRGGGKIYVSDYAYSVVEMPWPKFLWFTDPLHGGCQEDRFPDGCNHGPPFDAPSRSPDQGLSEWLLAVDPAARPSQTLAGRADFRTKENWDTIGSIAADYVGENVDTGKAESLTPRVWVEGTWNYAKEDAPDDFDRQSYHPFTVSWPYGCGRVLFTTYHTVGGTGGMGRHPGLLTQELVLWHLIMELQACQEIRVE